MSKNSGKNEAKAEPTEVPADELPAPVELTPEQINTLKEQASKTEEYWDRILRLTADFDNFKKRTTRERQDLLKYSNESLLAKLLPVLDNFDMALQAAAAHPEIQAGVAMILSQLKNVLIEAGLVEMDTLNKPFDPHFHEAIAQKETNDVAEGTIVQQTRKGYLYRDRLLRPASVIVAKKLDA